MLGFVVVFCPFRSQKTAACQAPERRLHRSAKVGASDWGALNLANWVAVFFFFLKWREPLQRWWQLKFLYVVFFSFHPENGGKSAIWTHIFLKNGLKPPATGSLCAGLYHRRKHHKFSADEMMRSVPNKKRQEEHVFDRFKSTSNVHLTSVGWQKISALDDLEGFFHPFWRNENNVTPTSLLGWFIRQFTGNFDILQDILFRGFSVRFFQMTQFPNRCQAAVLFVRWSWCSLWITRVIFMCAAVAYDGCPMWSGLDQTRRLQLSIRPVPQICFVLFVTLPETNSKRTWTEAHPEWKIRCFCC